MPEEGRIPPGLVFALGTLHATLLLVVVVLLVHEAGSAGPFFASVGTARGLALGAGLWLLSWGATWRALRGRALLPPPAAAEAVNAGARWGAVAGASFFAWLLLLLAPGVLAEAAAWFFVGFALVASFAIGGLVGALFAALDLAVLRLALRAAPADA